MKINLSISHEPEHSDIASCVCWASSEEIISASDDHLIFKKNLNTGESAKLLTMGENVYPTDLQWFPRLLGNSAASSAGGPNKRTALSPNDIFVIASTDGRFHIVLKSGKIEKSVEAHNGAILSLRWSFDGNNLLTSGEDGLVKVWSRSGMLRSTLSQNAMPIYCASWSPNSDQILYSSGKQIVIKPIQANAKPIIWKAHDGIVLKCDWNPVNNFIISGGEDCKYKVWDVFGRTIYSSSSFDYPITSLVWAPDGNLFAVGSYNTLRVCDKSGWSYSMEKCEVGSILGLNWSSDSTQLAAACGSGHILVGSLTNVKLEWQQYEAIIENEKQIKVRNVVNNSVENLEFRDRIVTSRLNFNHLIVVTSNQCYVYNVSNWNTPVIIELRECCVTLVIQSEKNFLLVDGGSLCVYSYDGRVIANLNQKGLRPQMLHSGLCTISIDTLCIRDKSNEKLIYFFEISAGKQNSEPKTYEHKMEVTEISLSQNGSVQDRRLALLDKNMDLYLMPVKSYGRERKVVKLNSMVSSIMWNDSLELLTAIESEKLLIWLYPNTAFVMKDLMAKVITEKSIKHLGRQPMLMNFHDNAISFRKMDGSIASMMINPHPIILQKCILSNRWNEAVKLCRFTKDPVLWASLAAMAIAAKDLNTAETAFAAIQEVDKVEYIQFIKSLPIKEAKNAQILLLTGNFQDGEGVLIQSGLYFQSIMLNINMYRWDRALELALTHKIGLDIVQEKRRKFLISMDRNEANKKFLQLPELESKVDLKKRIADEEKEELNRYQTQGNRN